MNKFAKFYLEKLGAEINSIMKPLSGGGVSVRGFGQDPGYGKLVVPRPAGTSTIELHGGGKGTTNDPYGLWINRSESEGNTSTRGNTSEAVDNDSKWQNMTSNKNLEALRSGLKNTDSIVATSCNHDGGGCPEDYENWAGHDLREVVMTPKNYYGRSDAVESPFKWKFDSLVPSLIGKDKLRNEVSPLHTYTKDSKGQFQDQGIYADGRVLTRDDVSHSLNAGFATSIPTAVRAAVAAETAGKSFMPVLGTALGSSAKSVAAKASLINFGIQVAGEARETVSQGGVGNHLKKMDYLNNDPDYTYTYKILSNQARPIGSLLSVGAKTPGVARYLSGFDEPDPDPTPWNNKRILQGSNFKGLTGGKPGYGINRNTVIPSSTPESLDSFRKAPYNVGRIQPTQPTPGSKENPLPYDSSAPVFSELPKPRGRQWFGGKQ